MPNSRSLKGFLPATSFVMSKRGEVPSRQEMPDLQNLSSPPSEATTTHRPLPASSHPLTHYRFLFLDASSELGGDASELLEKMIAAMGVNRDDVVIANLSDFQKSASAKIVVALGEPAARHLIESKDSFADMRGKVHRLKTGEHAIVTFHPVFLLKNPLSKKDAWEDLKLAMRI